MLFALFVSAGGCGLSVHPIPEPASPPGGESEGGSSGSAGGSPGATGGRTGTAGQEGQTGAGGAAGGRPRDGGADRRSADTGVAPDAAPAEPIDPPAGGSGDLVIGGRAVPKDKVIVFIHIGHSNMAGRTNTPLELRPFNFETHPQLWAFSTGAWQPAREPTAGDYYTRGRAGPGMSILRTGLSMAPDATIVSIAKAQDGSRGGECKAFRRGGLFYDVVMGPARQLKGKVTFGGIFSMLVLMDIFDKPTLPRANECMEAVARDMREDLGDPNIPFVMSDWEMGATGQFDPRLPAATLARERLRVAQMNIARSVIVPTDGLPMSDDHHFDLTGYKMWAERAFALMRDAGWTPWAQAAPGPK